MLHLDFGPFNFSPPWEASRRFLSSVMESCLTKEALAQGGGMFVLAARTLCSPVPRRIWWTPIPVFFPLLCTISPIAKSSSHQHRTLRWFEGPPISISLDFFPPFFCSVGLTAMADELPPFPLLPAPWARHRPHGAEVDEGDAVLDGPGGHHPERPRLAGRHLEPRSPSTPPPPPPPPKGSP